MSDTQIGLDEARLILEEIRALRQDMVGLHRETHAALDGIRRLLSDVRHIEETEQTIERDLEQMAERVDGALEDQLPSLSTCEVCGSQVNPHQAPEGLLLICQACGHTAFYDRRIGERRHRTGQVVEEGVPEPGEETGDWTKG